MKVTTVAATGVFLSFFFFVGREDRSCIKQAALNRDGIEQRSDLMHMKNDGIVNILNSSEKSSQPFQQTEGLQSHFRGLI